MKISAFSSISFFCLLAMALSSCQKEESDVPEEKKEQEKFVLSATLESAFFLDDSDGTGTKTVSRSDGQVLWSPHDTISFFIGENYRGGIPLVSDNTSPAAEANFSGKIAKTSGAQVYYALYPYNANASFSGGTFKTVIPSEQTAVEGSFGDKLFISVGRSENNVMKFYHLCGGFKFSVDGDGISKIKISSNFNGPNITGEITISFQNGVPVILSNTHSTGKEITVYAPDGGYFTPGKYYYAMLPPVEFNTGLTIKYYRDNEYCSFSYSSKYSVQRATFGQFLSKDKDRPFYPAHLSYASFFSPGQFLPKGADKTDITEMQFFTNSDKKTDIIVTDSTRPDSMPIYLELDGTVVKYYTEADCYTASSFNTLFKGFSSLKTLDLSNWDFSGVNDMGGMFYGCESLESINFSNINTSCVTNMGLMFCNCNSLKLLDLSNFDTSNVCDMSLMFKGCSSLKTLDLTNFNTSDVKNMSSMFFDCNNLTSIDLSSFDTSNVTDMFAMFYQCLSLNELDISRFNTSKVSDMTSMFQGCKHLTSLDLSAFDTSNVTDMFAMFDKCCSLDELDLSSFNTSKVSKLNSMFQDCINLTSIDVSSFDTSNVTTMSQMFACCKKLRSLDLSSFKTSRVKTMENMFYGCFLLKELDLSGFDTSEVTDMVAMFYYCTSIPDLDLTSFNTSKVSDMSYMFQNCTHLTSLDLSSFDTSNVTAMYQMFVNCASLQSLDISSFNTSRVKTMENMFYGCVSLKELDLSGFETSEVTDMYGMFYDCQLISELDLTGFDTSNVNDMSFMFSGCYNLSYLNLSTIGVEYVPDTQNMCYLMAESSRNCSIVCSSDTKKALEYEDVGLNCKYIHWFLDGEEPDDRSFRNAALISGHHNNPNLSGLNTILPQKPLLKEPIVLPSLN